MYGLLIKSKYSQFRSVEYVLTQFLVMPCVSFHALAGDAHHVGLGHGADLKVKGQLDTPPIIHHRASQSVAGKEE